MPRNRSAPDEGDDLEPCDDNCWTSAYDEPDQTDSDGDCPDPPYDHDPQCGDDCDNCPEHAYGDHTDGDNDSFLDILVTCSGSNQVAVYINQLVGGDPDEDEIVNQFDNCDQDFNPDQADLDSDGIGDACDNCPGDSNPDQLNSEDGDEYADACDNCPSLANADQADGDSDGTGDVCDNCPGMANEGQSDTDLDGVGDLCDLCPDDADPTNGDVDEDGLGDVCDPDADDDGIDNDGDLSGIAGDNPCTGGLATNCDDNCPLDFNPLQEDADGNGVGNVCQAPIPTLTSPVPHALNVHPSSSIEVEFDVDLDPDSWFEGAVEVSGNLSGQYEGSCTYDGAPAITFNPARSFLPGEVITVKVLPVIYSDVYPVGMQRGYTWSFTVSTAYDDSGILHQASGVFDLPEHYSAVTTGANGLVVTDVDKDRDPDFSFIQAPLLQSDWSYLKVIDNASSSNWHGDETSYCVGGEGAVHDLCAGDVTGDGLVDLVVTNRMIDSVSVFESYWNGLEYLFRETTTQLYMGGRPSAVCSGDFDGNGVDDVAAIIDDPVAVSVVLFSSSGSPSEYRMIEVPFVTRRIISADVDSDGDFDLVGAAQHLYVLANNGDGTFADPLQSVSTFDACLSRRDLHVADLDADGKLDVITCYQNCNYVPNGFVAVHFGDGEGFFGEPTVYQVEFYPDVVTTGDLDGDGDLDVALGCHDATEVGYVYVLMNDGEGNLGSRRYVVDGQWAANDIVAADINDDGHLDLVTTNDCTKPVAQCNVGFSAKLSVYENLGTVPNEPEPIWPDPGDRTTDQTPTIRWSDHFNADSHMVEVWNAGHTYSSSAISDPSWTVTSTLGYSDWIWHAKSRVDGEWTGWSDEVTFTVYTPGTGPPSCPVLFTFDGEEFIQEEPLLTACEASGYVDVVTDFYHVQERVGSSQGKVRFQIRELEDEITYLDEVGLLTIDHDPETEIVVDVAGGVWPVRDIIAPISAVDHLGNDVLKALAARDGKLFESKESGHVVARFVNPEDSNTIFRINLPPKRLCPPNKVAPEPQSDSSDAEQHQVSVEFLGDDGSWVRMETSGMLVTNQFPEIDAQDTVTIRLSWQGEYVTDDISCIVPSEQPVTVFEWMPVASTFKSGDLMARNVTLDGEQLIMNKGDVLNFEFLPDQFLAPGLVREYVIKAVGRYKPNSTALAEGLPRKFELYDNYPNPFNPTTAIQWSLPSAGEVRLEIFNTVGQKVRTLANAYYPAGRHSLEWDSRNDAGRKVATGVYLYRLTAGEYVETKKMMLLK